MSNITSIQGGKKKDDSYQISRVVIAWKTGGHVEHEKPEYADLDPFSSMFVVSFDQGRKVFFYNPDSIEAISLEGEYTGEPEDESNVPRH